MPANDLRLLVEAAKAAGKIATPFWRQSLKVWEKDASAGPVTEADLAVDNMLQDRLLAARPNYGWLSEESVDDDKRLAAKRVFVIDPIDGTRSFIAGERTWAHSLAVVEDGRVISAAVYLPLRGKLYTAHLGGGAYLNGYRISSSTRSSLEGAQVLSAKASFDPAFWSTEIPSIGKHFRSSLAYRLALVAEGRFDAMLSFRNTWEWDVAAGSLLVTEAGANVSDRKGNPAIFNNPTPAIDGMIAASPGVHHELRQHLH